MCLGLSLDRRFEKKKNEISILNTEASLSRKLEQKFMNGSLHLTIVGANFQIIPPSLCLQFCITISLLTLFNCHPKSAL